MRIDVLEDTTESTVTGHSERLSVGERTGHRSSQVSNCSEAFIHDPLASRSRCFERFRIVRKVTILLFHVVEVIIDENRAAHYGSGVASASGSIADFIGFKLLRDFSIEALSNRQFTHS